jgi:hypothetical protein
MDYYWFNNKEDTRDNVKEIDVSKTRFSPNYNFGLEYFGSEYGIVFSLKGNITKYRIEEIQINNMLRFYINFVSYF